MQRLVAIVLLLLLIALTPGGAKAQDPASLVADSVSIAGDDTLVAEGNVEVFHKGRRLRASRIVYDATANRLQIDGPIVLTDPTGSVIVADQAELSADLSEGILIGARMVLDQQIQLAASEIMRIGGRYTVLGRSVSSSCKVCAKDSTPLWEIRARRIVHDEVERQIYFDQAVLRFGGVPVAWIPRLRMPDPTLSRASGFLFPTFRSNSDLGFGIMVPYFATLGPSRDLTIMPFIATKDAVTVSLRYRQAFANGGIDLTGALSQDDILPGQTRGYLTGTGSFALPRGFLLEFGGTMVSDPTYLLDYDLGDQDRLEGVISASRFTSDEFLTARLMNLYSLRPEDVNSTLPSIIADATWARTYSPTGIGGEALVLFQAHSHYRSSDDPDYAPGASISYGRDTSRLSARADWGRDAVFASGIVATALAEGRIDLYAIDQDIIYEGDIGRLAGGVGAELRWPFTRSTAGGAAQVLEPVVQLLWSGSAGGDVPDEDSILAEFDEGNLFTIDRPPGYDAIEEGLRANLGLAFTHIAPTGTSTSLALGRVFRASPTDIYSDASGLAGQNSDWLAVLNITGASGLSMTNRLVFDDDFDMTSAEFRLAMQSDLYTVASSYAYVIADEEEGRSDPISEIMLDASVQLSPAWTANAVARYDFIADEAEEAGLTVAWSNECLKVDLYLSRRFLSSTNLDPTTDFGVSVELLGFGGTSGPGPARACRG